MVERRATALPLLDLIDNLLPADTRSPEETLAIGRRIAALLEPGDIVTLQGELGAGKTHLVKGICAGLGIDPHAVTSPTFAIVQTYDGDIPVHHVDAYRIERIEEFYELGYEDIFFGDGLTLLEWPERVAPLVPAEAIRLRLSHVGDDGRRIEVDRTPGKE